MKSLIKQIAVSATLLLTLGVSQTTVAATSTLDQLLEEVKKDRISDGQINKQREQEFLNARADKQKLLADAKATLKREQNRGQRLADQFSQNEITLVNKETELTNAQGTLGEMFGVVRRTANDTIGSISSSIISAQYPGRDQVLIKLANAKELPTTKELEELWIALQTEMTESAKVIKFDAEVVNLDGSKSIQPVTRIGNFNLLTGDSYLIYNDDTQQIQPLGRVADGHYRSAVGNFTNTSPGQLSSLYVDPTRGSLLRLNTQKATLRDRYEAGGTVGYVITAVLILGLLIAVERLFTLTLIGVKIRSQLKDTSKPNLSNPLGRILKVYHDNKNSDIENLELKLDEATLKELPRIERGITLIKILAAIAPLLGLLGTVVGMINTFQQITLFGTGDPRIMAGSISMALVTTAQGLIAALPLILVHSIVAARSKSVIHILDEQSAGIIAEHAEKERA